MRSDLDHVIAPEIVGGRLASWLARIAGTPGVRHVLDIGASSGTGSTAALAGGAMNNPDGPPTLHCIELSEVRFAELERRYRSTPFVRCYRACSIARDDMPTRGEVRSWARSRPIWSRLRVPTSEILRWYDQDVEYLARPGVRFGGIATARRAARVERFDAVVIDGSEFTGKAELAEVLGARFLMLDDIRTFKNRENHQRLLDDRRYELLASGRRRNGFAVFERR